MNGATNAPEAPSTWSGTSRPVSASQRVERRSDLLHGLVRAVERRAEDRHDADRVLVAALDGLLGGEVEAIALHRHEPHLDVPVVRELLPAHLDVDAHDDVRLVGRLPRGRSRLLPAPLEREPAEHRRLARARRRAARRLVCFGRMPEPAEDVDAAHLELGGLRILVLVDHVLVEALGHEPLRLRLHPRADERGEVEPRIPVEHQLVVDDLVRAVRRHLVCRQLVARDVRRVERERRCGREVVLPRRRALRMLQRHRLSLPFASGWNGWSSSCPGWTMP